jgi:glucosamine--fructose-6-phosphate aminotransferase (isomerizing)
LCGIVGYVTDNPEISLREFVEGCWRDLQYRGHQGFGVAIFPEGSGRLYRFRRPGRLRESDSNGTAEFFESIPEDSVYSILTHTRWPTHGGDLEKNSHPHMDSDGRVAVVHNGTVKNYFALREQLYEKSELVSDTDTELIAHMLADMQSGDIHGMVRGVADKIQGDNVFVFSSVSHPGKIVGVKVGLNPLAVARGYDGNFLTSDPEAVLGDAYEISRLGVGEYAIIGHDAIEIWNLDGKRIHRDFEPFEWGYDDVDKMGYPTFTEKEIYQQPEAVLDSLEANYDIIGEFAEELLRFPDTPFVACGTSYHAAALAQQWGEILAGEHFPVYGYEMNPRSVDSVFWISQSGRTFELVKMLEELLKRNPNLYSMGLVNKKHGDLEAMSDKVAYIRAGPEIGVASTKAYIGQLSFLYLMMENLAAKVNGREIPSLETHPLRDVSRQIDDILERQGDLDPIADVLANSEKIIYMGNGLGYWTAREGGLKLEELASTQVKQISGMELKHGPLSSVDENTSIVAVAPRDSRHSSILNNIREVRSVSDGSKRPIIISVGTEGDSELEELSDYLFEVPEIQEELYPMTTVVPLQILGLKLAELKDCDVDQPRNIAKTITVE